MCVKTLYLENDFVIRSLYEKKLTKKGFEIHSVVQQHPVLTDYDIKNYDLFMYSTNKIGSVEIEMVTNVREMNPSMGIVVISDQLTKENKMELYEAGTDKLFLSSNDIDVTIASLCAFKRRLETLNYRLKLGDVSFNVAQQYVEKDNKLAHLNPTESKLLLRLAGTSEEEVVSGEEIREMLNQNAGYENTQGTKVYIYRIRKKLERINSSKVEIKNNYGQGYYLQIEE